MPGKCCDSHICRKFFKLLISFTDIEIIHDLLTDIFSEILSDFFSNCRFSKYLKKSDLT